MFTSFKQLLVLCASCRFVLFIAFAAAMHFQNGRAKQKPTNVLCLKALKVKLCVIPLVLTQRTHQLCHYIQMKQARLFSPEQCAVL